MISHCVTLFKNKQEEKVFRFYVTDALKVISSNTARMVNGGVELKLRYADIIDTSKKHVEERSEEEIRNDIINKLRNINHG